MSLVVATGRYFDRAAIEASGLVPLQTTVGPPRFGLGYELGGAVGPIAPHGLFKIEDIDEFLPLYTARLDGFGVDRIAKILQAFAHAYQTDGVAVLCFCDLRKGGWCHRQAFAQWWRDQTGVDVAELSATDTDEAA